MGRDGYCNGLTKEGAARRAVLQISVECCEEAADLWGIELDVTDEFDLAALCDVGDSAFEERRIDAKD